MIFFIKWCADLKRCIGINERFFHRVIDRIVDNEPSGSGAALAGSSHSRKDDGRNCQLQVIEGFNRMFVSRREEIVDLNTFP